MVEPADEGEHGHVALGQPEVGLGIIPGAGATYRMPKLVGLGVARELIFTGRMIDAPEALELGLVSRVTEPADLMDEAMALAEQGGFAMIIALLLIFAYVMFRFQWKFAAGAVAALAHDAIVTVGFFSIFQLPFDLTVVAAVLAVIGYSLNDTVVALDRIRENFTKLRGTTPEEAMNVSINEMLARTIITGLTTLLVLFALLTLGGESIAPFSIALIVGIIVGTYSSIYTASATALMLHVTPQDLMPPEVDPELIDDLP